MSSYRNHIPATYVPDRLKLQQQALINGGAKVPVEADQNKTAVVKCRSDTAESGEQRNHAHGKDGQPRPLTVQPYPSVISHISAEGGTHCSGVGSNGGPCASASPCMYWVNPAHFPQYSTPYAHHSNPMVSGEEGNSGAHSSPPGSSVGGVPQVAFAAPLPPFFESAPPSGSPEVSRAYNQFSAYFLEAQQSALWQRNHLGALFSNVQQAIVWHNESVHRNHMLVDARLKRASQLLVTELWKMAQAVREEALKMETELRVGVYQVGARPVLAAAPLPAPSSANSSAASSASSSPSDLDSDGCEKDENEGDENEDNEEVRVMKESYESELQAQRARYDALEEVVTIAQVERDDQRMRAEYAEKALREARASNAALTAAMRDACEDLRRDHRVNTEERSRHVGELEALLAELQGRWRQMQSVLADIDAREQALCEGEQRWSAVQAEVSRQEGELRRMEAEMSRRDEEMQGFAEELARKDAELDRRSEELLAMGADLETERGRARDRAAELEEVQRRLEVQTKQAATYRTMVMAVMNGGDSVTMMREEVEAAGVAAAASATSSPAAMSEVAIQAGNDDDELELLQKELDEKLPQIDTRTVSEDVRKHLKKGWKAIQRLEKLLEVNATLYHTVNDTELKLRKATISNQSSMDRLGKSEAQLKRLTHEKQVMELYLEVARDLLIHRYARFQMRIEDSAFLSSECTEATALPWEGGYGLSAFTTHPTIDEEVCELGLEMPDGVTSPLIALFQIESRHGMHITPAMDQMLKMASIENPQAWQAVETMVSTASCMNRAAGGGGDDDGAGKMKPESMVGMPDSDIVSVLSHALGIETCSSALSKNVKQLAAVTSSNSQILAACEGAGASSSVAGTDIFKRMNLKDALDLGMSLGKALTGMTASAVKKTSAPALEPGSVSVMTFVAPRKEEGDESDDDKPICCSSSGRCDKAVVGKANAAVEGAVVDTDRASKKTASKSSDKSAKSEKAKSDKGDSSKAEKKSKKKSTK